MAESKELKSLLMEEKKESEKADLKLNIQKNEDNGIWSHHFMENRQGNNGNSERLYFGGLQDTADAGRDWGQEEKGMTEDEMAGWHH